MPALRRMQASRRLDDRDARRVVAAVLELAQPLHDDGQQRVWVRRSRRCRTCVKTALSCASRAWPRPSRACSACGLRDDRERIGRHVLRDGRSGGDVRARANAHRRDQLRIRSDERAVLDDGLVLVHAVVIARDRAGADVRALADRGVAQIRQMVGLRAASQRRFLELDEIADVRAVADVGLRAAGARTVRSARRHPIVRINRDRMIEHDDARADRGVRDAGSRHGCGSRRRSSSCPAARRPGR